MPPRLGLVHVTHARGDWRTICERLRGRDDLLRLCIGDVLRREPGAETDSVTIPLLLEEQEMLESVEREAVHA